MKFKSALLTATMGAAAITAISPASAQSLNAYGAGASLPANYVRQAADCYGVKTDLISRGITVGTTIDDFNYVGTPAFDCATDIVSADTKISYISTGSGGGIQTFYSHDVTIPGDSNLAVAGTQNYPTFTYALSETALGSSQVNIYNNGGTDSTVGVVVVAPGETPGTGEYRNPREAYGAMIQVPFLIAPVTIAFDPVYKKVGVAPGTGNAGEDGEIQEYSFNLYFARADGSGGLRLDAPTICKIFNGQITNWNAIELRQLNANRYLRDPSDPVSNAAFSVPLQIVARNDSSGTSSLWTRYLANVCSGLTGNSYNDSTSRMPGAQSGVDGNGNPVFVTIAAGGTSRVSTAIYNANNANLAAGVAGETLGLYTRSNGNEGVAKYIDFAENPELGETLVQGRIGYVGPDFALPAVLATGANDYNLVTADVKNASGSFRAPTGRNAGSAFTGLNAPDSDVGGNYDAALPGNRADPTAGVNGWAQAASKTSPLANPAYVSAYPIVGTTNLLTYTCYRSNSNRIPLTAFMKWYYTDKTVNDVTLGLLAQSGFAPMPSGWRKAIRDTFIFGNVPGLSALKINTRTTAANCPSTLVGA